MATEFSTDSLNFARCHKGMLNFNSLSLCFSVSLSLSLYLPTYLSIYLSISLSPIHAHTHIHTMGAGGDEFCHIYKKLYKDSGGSIIPTKTKTKRNKQKNKKAKNQKNNKNNKKT